nr:MAG TPA: hypothetical protein [Caudoviricetes sp.]
MKGLTMFTYSRLLDVYYISPENLYALAIGVGIGALILVGFVVAGLIEIVKGLINLPKEKKAAEELDELRSIKAKYNDLREIVLSDPNLRAAYAGLLADGE